MLCPSCKTENLLTSERQNVQIDHCPRCQGVWLERGELEKLIQLASTQDERQSDRYNGRQYGEDDEAPRKRGYGESNQDDDDDDRDDERGESRQSRDSDDDDDDARRTGGRSTYRNRDSDGDERIGRGEPNDVRSILREIFDNLSNKLPRS